MYVIYLNTIEKPPRDNYIYKTIEHISLFVWICTHNIRLCAQHCNAKKYYLRVYIKKVKYVKYCIFD